MHDKGADKGRAIYNQRYKDTSQLNAKNNVHVNGGKMRPPEVKLLNPYGRTESYGLAVKSNGQQNTTEPRTQTRYSSQGRVRPDSHAHIGKCDGSKVIFLLYMSCFWCSGIGLVVFSILQMFDDVQPELWNLIQVQLDSSLQAAPVLHQLTLGVLVVGVTVCLISCLGCWAGLQDRRGGVRMVIIMLVLIMMGEVSVAVLAILIKSLIETDLERDLVARLREEYNMPEAELFTRAIDLAQTEFHCCGVTGPQDYSGTAWQREVNGADSSLKLPLTCCALNSTTSKQIFLDPFPTDLDKCQNLDIFSEGFRNSEVCMYK